MPILNNIYWNLDFRDDTPWTLIIVDSNNFKIWTLNGNFWNLVQAMRFWIRQTSKGQNNKHKKTQMFISIEFFKQP